MTDPVKKILFISYDGMTDPLGQSQVIPYLQGLSLHGYEIFLVSCEKKTAFQQNKTTVEQLLKGYNIQWMPLYYTKKPPVLSTLIDIIKLKRAARKIYQAHKIDLVHTRPGVPALVGLWMKKKMGVKFLNDIREFYADSRVEGGMWNVKNPLYKMIYRFFKRKETEAVEQSDGIVCLTHAAKIIIQQWPAYKKNTPLQVIPCSVDLSLFDPLGIDTVQRSLVKKELNIGEDDFIVSYLGSIGGWYLIAEMMQFCKLLSEKKPSTKFLFISPHRHDEIVAAAVKYGVSSEKIITKKADRSEVPLLLSLSDYSIFFIKPCYSKQSSSPTKHGEIMAMGIPLITNSGVGDVKEIVLRYNSGIVLDEFTETAFSVTVDKIVSGYSYDAADIRQGAKDFYSLDAAIKKYNEIYGEIFKDS
jgi:glycosyltransferase involved in cell wall biosynthesis